MRERTSMRRIREALRLVYQQGMSRNQAARALNIGSSTLKDLLKRFQSSGLPLEAALQLGDSDLEEHLFARPNQRGSRVAEPDMEHVASELKRPGVTLKLLWEEYRKVHPTGLGYTQFCDRHNKHRGGQDLVMRQNHKPGEKVMVLANREPYIHERGSDGTVQIRHPASGLVAAIEPVLRACSGVWIAHGSGSADRTVVDNKDHVRVPPGEESYELRRVWLSEQEERGYYYGLANEGLWPLCHLAHARPIFRGTDWATYEAVNRRFAEAVCDEAEGEDPVVLVQDYHFALVPRLVRERRPRATIITFWHIPWPNGEHFGICPWRGEILQGMLGSSILGFHTRQHCNNFLDSVDRYLEARIDREQNSVVQHGRATLVRPYPISIEWPSRWVASAPPVAECRSGVRKELGLREDALLGLGVDRLDYTKGIEERLLAVERFLERFPAFAGRFSFVQMAAPSRSLIERYRQLDETVERTAARINQRFGEGAYQPIILLRAHHEPPQVFRYYRAADLCYVSSLHDGMNLVAKEFAAARDDERGVLLLSQFTGAAREMSEALVVNPYDLEEASAAMARALAMSVDEQRERMRAMRAFLAEFNVYRWAGRMLMDAARLRRKETLLGRSSDDISSLRRLPK